jgi:hypothetical protein
MLPLHHADAGVNASSRGQDRRSGPGTSCGRPYGDVVDRSTVRTATTPRAGAAPGVGCRSPGRLPCTSSRSGGGSRTAGGWRHPWCLPQCRCCQQIHPCRRQKRPQSQKSQIHRHRPCHLRLPFHRRLPSRHLRAPYHLRGPCRRQRARTGQPAAHRPSGPRAGLSRSSWRAPRHLGPTEVRLGQAAPGQLLG